MAIEVNMTPEDIERLVKDSIMRSTDEMGDGVLHPPSGMS